MSTRVSARSAARPDGALILAPPLAALVGFAVAAGLWLYVLELVIVAAAVLAGLRNWRFSVLALLVFLPYSGLLIIASHPDTGPAVLAKDVLFVIPAYLGFGGAYLLQRRDVSVPGFPLALVVALATVTLLQLLNPTLPNLLVGIIGMKVWLMYIPMAVLGYHLIQRREDLERMLRLMALVAIVPCVIGIVEGVLIGQGQAASVYRLYGDAAGVVSQGFADVGGEVGQIRRVPSTFSFVTQYYLFTMAMLAVAYAYWRGFLARKRGLAPLIGVALFTLVAFAAVLSGARGALLGVPLLTVLMLLLDGFDVRRHWLLPVAAVAAIFAAASVFGTSPSALVSEVADHGFSEFSVQTVDGFRDAFDRTVFGLGTGVDSVPARYALPEFDPYALVGGKFAESWWVKALLELGIVGLVLVVVLMLSVLARLAGAHLRVKDPSLRAVSAAFVALAVFVVFYNFKASYLDLDPMNVIFWLFVGITLKLPRLEEEQERPRPAGAG